MYGRLRIPPEPTSDGERKVIKVFFSIAFAVALIFLAWAWHSRTQECVAASCECEK